MSPPAHPIRSGLPALAWRGIGALALWAGGARAAPLEPSYTSPSPEQLHPVRPQPFLAWHRAVADVMAGPDASPLFRDTSTAMDVRWRLVAAGEELFPASDTEEQKALDLSLQGATLGLSRATWEALSRSEVLAVAGKVVRTGLRPSVVVERRPDGPRLRLDERAWSSQLSRASVSEGPRLGERRAPRPPSLRVGGGARLIEDPDLDTDQPLSNLQPAVQGWVGLERLGLEAMQLDVTWFDPTPDQDPRIWYELVARQRIVGRLSLRAELESDDDLLLPDAGRAGLAWQIPEHPGWRIGLDGVRRFPRPYRAGDEGEWRAELRLWSTLDWRVPVDIDRWPLGHEIGEPGPTMLALRPSGPNLASPVALTADEQEQETLAGAAEGGGSAVEQAKREGGVVRDVGIR